MSKKRKKNWMVEPSVFETDYICKLHPKYKGEKPPTSTKEGCHCETVYKLNQPKKIASPRVSADKLIEAALARKDPSLHVTRAPEGYRLRGVSTLVDAIGNPVMQWVKTSKEIEAASSVLELFRESIAATPIKAAPAIKAAKDTDKDLLCVIPLGDLHFGMLSWPAETGEDYNLKIARANLKASIARLIELAPSAETCLIINLGDALHSDGYAAATTKGTKVDVDGRWPKMLQVLMESLIEMIQLAAKKFKRVHFKNEPGNHDVHAAYMITLCLAAFFKDSPHVEIDTNPSKFHYFEHGNNLIGSTHGDTLKIAAMPGVMATDQSAAWGRTKYRRMYVGHVHHTSVHEFSGCVVETVRTIAPKDAWAHAAGYRAGRSMFCDVWHKTRGKISRHEVEVAEIEAKQG